MSNQDRINYYSGQSALAPRDNEQTRRAVPIKSLQRGEVPLSILDVGVGSLADTYWLALEGGHDVIAVQPSDLGSRPPALHEYLEGNIPELGCGETEKQRLGILEELIKDRVYVANDHLPELASIVNSHNKYDRVLCGSVLQELNESDRKTALKTMLKLVKPGGALMVRRSEQLREGRRAIPSNEIAALCKELNQDSAFSLECIPEHSCSAPHTTAGGQFQEYIIHVQPKERVADLNSTHHGKWTTDQQDTGKRNGFQR